MPTSYRIFSAALGLLSCLLYSKKFSVVPEAYIFLTDWWANSGWGTCFYYCTGKKGKKKQNRKAKQDKNSSQDPRKHKTKHGNEWLLRSAPLWRHAFSPGNSSYVSWRHLWSTYFCKCQVFHAVRWKLTGTHFLHGAFISVPLQKWRSRNETHLAPCCENHYYSFV